MLPLLHRLPGYLIPSILETGTRTQGHYITIIQTRAQEHDQPSKFTVIVPYRLSKKASVRNRTRRLLREALRHVLPNTQQGFNVIVMAQSLLQTTPISDIEHNVTSTLGRAHLLTNN